MGWEPDEKVILHELLHLKHRDLWAGWLTAALRCLHWCDPLLWLVFDKVDNDREALCDQRVLERLEGEDRRDYGRGVLSMARAMHPDSAGSQFFIMVAPAPHLDGQYAAFGQVTGNVEEAIRISEVPTDWNDKPKTPVVIQSIRVDTQGVDYPEPEKR